MAENDPPLTTTETLQARVNEGAEFLQGAIDYILTFIQTNWLNVVFALVIFFGGKWLARVLSNGLKSRLTKREVDGALVGFLGTLVYFFLMVAVVIAAIQQVGISTTSFIAMLGAAGLAIGLALQGSLSNFAAGTLIILFKPFKLGDFVEAGGTSGVVLEIGMLMTVMKSLDNKKIVVPNRKIMDDVITNVTANPVRRIDMTWGVSYDDDPEKVKEVIMEELVKHPDVLEDPAPQVELWEFADSSVNFVVRPWVEAANWWPTRCQLMISIKKRLDAEGMSIPFPQRDVHLFQDKAE